MGKDCSGASCPLSPREGGQLTSPSNLHSFHCSALSLGTCMLFWGEGLLFKGEGRQLPSSQVKTGLKTKPQHIQHPVSFRDFP